MFAKLSALVLCLSLVSALKIRVPPSSIKAGTSFDIELSQAEGDPGYIGLMLIQVDYNTIDNLGTDVGVAPQVSVHIPINITPGQYFIEANQVGDEHQVIVGSNSNTFTVTAA